MVAPLKLHWNGTDLPLELRDLPPGEYVLQLAEPAPLLPSEAEDTSSDDLDALDADERAELDREIEASFDDDLIDASDAIADLRDVR